jgi:tRNA(Ile2) C34 agmatinyltransferase TiaS
VPVENVEEVTELSDLNQKIGRGQVEISAMEEEKAVVAAIGKAEERSFSSDSSVRSGGLTSQYQFDFGRMQADLALRASGSDAPSCSDCGMTMVRNGACYKCPDCGATSGCS